ncbi:translation initiation factor IF-2-like [Zalophus californianus]|uniref:Translation initiation factor IF-2-like n=1 Tax=Zalophus californianus TaxID=9704 RepID=A0A6J2FHZ3_ZALCA|nr:translation initiation factor IF-2-like [Zalophus californianus]
MAAILPTAWAQWLAALLEAAVPRARAALGTQRPALTGRSWSRGFPLRSHPGGAAHCPARGRAGRVRDPRRHRAGSQAGANSRRGAEGQCSDDPGGRDEGEEEQEAVLLAPTNFIGLKFPLVSLPLACRAGLCVRGFWKVLGSGHILGRFSRHLPRRGGGGGGGGSGQRAGRHHPPRRTHGRTPAGQRGGRPDHPIGGGSGRCELEMGTLPSKGGSRRCSRPGSFPGRLRPSLQAGTKHLQAPGEQRPSPQGRRKEVRTLRITKKK